MSRPVADVVGVRREDGIGKNRPVATEDDLRSQGVFPHQRDDLLHPVKHRQDERHADDVVPLLELPNGHPNIVTVYDTGEHDGYPWIAMELVDGKSLRELVAKGTPSMRRLVHIAAQVADGLAAAHEKGITHSDLKPENNMVTPQGLVKILDFGLAKQATALAGVDQTTVDASLATGPGRFVGTLSYLSPEQA